MDPYEGKVTADSPSSTITTLFVPDDVLPGDNIHIVLEAVDDGTPALTRYHRVIFKVEL